MRTRSFTDLVIWQEGMQLARAVYRETEKYPKHEVFGLTSQLRRAAVSVPSNIAEGHGRTSDKVFRHFIGQARGSLYELQTQLMLSADLDYLPAAKANELIECCRLLARRMNALIRQMKTTG